MWSSFSSLTASLRQMAGTWSADQAAVEEGLERMKRLRDRIQARIRDAEEGEVVEQLERQYLRELRGVALDAEDVVDEWDYELLRAEVEDEPPHKRRRGEAAPLSDLVVGDAALRNRMSRQIREITRRFDEITELGSALRLGRGNGAQRRGDGHPPPSSSLVGERYVYDREDYKEILVDFMLSNDGVCAASNLTVVPIVGMGLVGKTTLVQLIYNDIRVAQHFDSRGWVSLPGSGSDLKSLLQSAVESLTSERCCCENLGTIQGILRRCLMGKRFLLILDDVCRENLSIWEQFKASIRCGSLGSVVIITTKVGEVAERMKSATVQEFYLFQGTSDESCWHLFKKYASAFAQDTLEGPDMAGICHKVIEICGGMPMVAKLLGISFRSHSNRDAWMDFMEDIVEDEILPKLRSSYQALPVHLKHCLSYCALFPKGYLFNRDRLVRLWMAQGLLIQHPRNRKQPEDIGIQYFNELISRSFFLPSLLSETDEELYFMPNLICYLLYSISRNEHSRVEDVNSLPSEARHLSLVSKSITQCVSFYEYNGLRSFLVMHTFPFTSILHLEIQDEMFHRLNRLRSLDLSYTDIQALPDSVGYLKHLRFLALNHTKIRRLPGSIHMLYNLQTLELKRCSRLEELPSGIGSLINLRHLDVDSDYLLACMPFQIQRLTSLQMLPTFNLKKGDGICRIAELRDLTSLRELGISGLCNVTKLDDAKNANMQNKVCLKILKLIWPSSDAVLDPERFTDFDHQNLPSLADEAVEEDEQNDHDLKDAHSSVDKQSSSHEKPSSHDADDKPHRLMDIPDEQESTLSSIQLRDGINNMGIQDSVVTDAEVSDEDLLECLRPYTTLEMLSIKSYGGTRFPDWIGAPSFSKLISMELLDCKCVVFPSLGLLPYLQLLSIDGTSVQLVGKEFCGTGNANAFQKLKTLSFYNMNKWEEWSGMLKGDFPNLNSLCLFNCPHLRRVPDIFSSLEVLEVERCMELTDIPNLPSLQELHLCCCDTLTTLPTTLTSLRRLTIMYCQKLEQLPPLPKLESRWIEECELLPSVLPDT